MTQLRKGSTIGYIGLGKMGLNMVTRMKEEGFKVVAFDPDLQARERAKKAGAVIKESIPELLGALPAPRTVWLMVPHQVVDEVLTEFNGFIEFGDTVIDGGNSPYNKSIDRSQMFAEGGVKFVDIGVSGGPEGARHGACLMVGGPKEEYDRLVPLLRRLAVPDGYGYMGSSGAGHFVKMVHNGIEYGMMQAIAEGFEVMRRSEFGLDLQAAARVYRHGSVISSRLMDWTEAAYEKWGGELEQVSGRADASGEADWTARTAERLGVSVPAIREALNVRYASQKEPSYQGKVISALRSQFGGHSFHSEDEGNGNF